MDIQVLHMQNNAYRDIIENFKRQIADYDAKIRANETEIGQQLEAMEQQNIQSTAYSDCTLCMGACEEFHDYL